MTTVDDTLYQIPVRGLDGTDSTLACYRGKVLLIVNVASACGFTPQYAGLEALYRSRQDRGLVVLGFPCNQFGKQEPGCAADIAAFTRDNYDVTFPVFEKIEVNGDRAHPLYELLKREAPGLLGTQAIKWNFTKFLVDRQGTIVKRFATSTKPAAIEPAIDELLGQQA
ncbi:MAG TPA: glutathione peroxidase [Polyangiaceae bacterium]